MNTLKQIFDWIAKLWVDSFLWKLLASHFVALFTYRIMGYPKFPCSQYFAIKEAYLKDPNALYAFVGTDHCSMSWCLTHWFGGGQWGHAGIVNLDADGELQMWHMKGDGLNRWPLLDYLSQIDNFALLKLPLSPDKLPIAVARFNKLISSPQLLSYDFTMGLDPEVTQWLAGQIEAPAAGGTFTIYCSEFDYYIGQGLIDNPEFAPKTVYGHQTFTPDQVFASCEMVYLYYGQANL